MELNNSLNFKLETIGIILTASSDIHYFSIFNLHKLCS